LADLNLWHISFFFPDSNACSTIPQQQLPPDKTCHHSDVTTHPRLSKATATHTKKASSV